MKRRMKAVVVLCLAVVAWAGAPSEAVAEVADCSDELWMVPEPGATVEITDPWLSVSGNLALGGLHDAESGPFSLSQDGEAMDGASFASLDGVASHLGIDVPELEAGTSYEWSVGDDGVSGAFEVSAQAQPHEGRPEFEEGELEVDMELINYEEFPVLFREWTLSFPVAGQAGEAVERYVVTFVNQEEEESDRILVTSRQVEEGRVTVGLGGRSDKCQHVEPDVAITDAIEIQIEAVGLSGTTSEEPVTGIFEGVSEEKLAEAYEGFRGVIDGLDTDEEMETTEEVVQQMEAEEEESDGCSVSGSSGAGGSLGLLLVMLGALGWRRRGSG